MQQETRGLRLTSMIELLELMIERFEWQEIYTGLLWAFAAGYSLGVTIGIAAATRNKW